MNMAQQLRKAREERDRLRAENAEVRGEYERARAERDEARHYARKFRRESEKLEAVLRVAVARVEIANAEGYPILGAWLSGAKDALENHDATHPDIISGWDTSQVTNVSDMFAPSPRRVAGERKESEQ